MDLLKWDIPTNGAPEYQPIEHPSIFRQEEKTLPAEFYWGLIDLGLESKLQGRRIQKKVPFIRIIVPGNKTMIEREATDGDRMKYPRQWAFFEKGEEQQVEGTALDKWPMLDIEQVANLKSMRIFTVEQLIECSDTALQQVMGGVAMREKAKAFVAIAKDSALNERITEENTKLRDLITTLTSQVESLKEMVIKSAVAPTVVEKIAPKKKPGRPARVPLAQPLEVKETTDNNGE